MKTFVGIAPAQIVPQEKVMQYLTKDEYEADQEKEKQALIRKNRVPQKFKVTLTKNGSLSRNHINPSYANSNNSYYNNHYIWDDNKVFSDELEYSGYFGSSGGNSHIELISVKSGSSYHMFMSDFDEVVQDKKFVDNKIIGKFYFCKKGNSQGIRLVFE